MTPDLQSLVGQPLRSIEKKDYSWSFIFDDDAEIIADAPWRFVTPEGIYVASEDHGEPFGLPAPIDAAEILRAAVAGLLVTAAVIHPVTGDFTITFTEDSELQILQTSCGYEAWRLHLAGTETICRGGGELATLSHLKVVK